MTDAVTAQKIAEDLQAPGVLGTIEVLVNAAFVGEDFAGDPVFAGQLPSVASVNVVGSPMVEDRTTGNERDASAAVLGRGRGSVVFHVVMVVLCWCGGW